MCSYDKLFPCLFLSIHRTGKGFHKALSPLILERISQVANTGLPARIQKALDIVRVIGNNAVHPGVIDLKDNQSTVHILFSLINQIVQDRITQPKEVNALYETLPEDARAAIEKRDTPSHRLTHN
jgi:hypothetical protein